MLWEEKTMNVIRTMVKVALAFSLLVLRCSFQMDQNLQENIELLEGGVKKKGCKKNIWRHIWEGMFRLNKNFRIQKERVVTRKHGKMINVKMTKKVRYWLGHMLITISHGPRQIVFA